MHVLPEFYQNSKFFSDPGEFLKIGSGWTAQVRLKKTVVFGQSSLSQCQVSIIAKGSLVHILDVPVPH